MVDETVEQVLEVLLERDVRRGHRLNVGVQLAEDGCDVQAVYGQLDRGAVVGELDGLAWSVVDQVPVGVGLQGVADGFGESLDWASGPHVGYLKLWDVLVWDYKD